MIHNRGSKVREEVLDRVSVFEYDITRVIEIHRSTRRFWRVLGGIQGSLRASMVIGKVLALSNGPCGSSIHI